MAVVDEKVYSDAKANGKGKKVSQAKPTHDVHENGQSIDLIQPVTKSAGLGLLHGAEAVYEAYVISYRKGADLALQELGFIPRKEIIRRATSEAVTSVVPRQVLELTAYALSPDGFVGYQLPPLLEGD